MKKALTTLSAATLALGLSASAPTAADANPLLIAPAAAAAWLAGGVVGGFVLGSAITANSGPFWNWGQPAAVAATPAVSVNSTTCYFTRAQVNGVWRRVQVCNNY